MDAVTTFKSGLLEFGLTQSVAGRYAGLEPSRVSRGVTEEMPFTRAESESITNTFAAMRSLQAEIPLPINWGLFGKVKPSLDQRKKELHEQGDPIVRKYTLIRTSSTTFFLRVNSGIVVTTPSELTACATEDPALARAIADEIKKLGTNSKIEFCGGFRRKSSMVNTMTELGFDVAVGDNNEQSSKA